MSRKQVVILWIAAFILAASAIYVRTHSSKGFDSHTARARGKTLFENFPAKEIGRIHITSGKDSTTLARKGDSWVVTDRADYPASSDSVVSLLRALREVKVVDGIEAEPSFAPRFGMDPNSSNPEEQGIDAVFSSDSGAELAHVTFGKTLGAGEDAQQQGGVTGRFIRNDADKSGVYKVSETFSGLAAQPSNWLDLKFLAVEKIQSITVSQPGRAEVDWKLTRTAEDADFTLEGKADNEPLDTAVTGRLKNLFSSSTFEDIVPPDKVAALARPAEARTVEIETFEGFHYKLVITPANLDVKPEAGAAPQLDEATFLATVETTATLPAERKKGDKETPEEAKSKDTAFAERKTALEKLLAEQKAFEGRTFKLSSMTVNTVMLERVALFKKPAAPPQGRNGIQSLSVPGGLMPLPQGHGPVQAVTPPIAVPPPGAPDDDQDPDDGH